MILPTNLGRHLVRLKIKTNLRSSYQVYVPVRNTTSSRNRTERHLTEPRDDWPLPDDNKTITPKKDKDEPRLAPEEVKGTEMETLWPTKKEMEENEWTKPQWERKQVNHVWYGFDYNDKFKDEVVMKERFFSMIVLGGFGFWFFYRYFPDRKLKHWCQREAYIRLATRESLGLSPIDPWYVPREKVILPTDEELGDMDIEV